MTVVLVAIHVLVCLFLIFVVLLQSAQAADLAGAFGGGGSQTALGMRGATTILQKATTAAAVIFMLTSLALGMSGRSGSSLIQGLEPTEPPAATAPQEDERQGAPEGERQGAEQQGAAESEQQGAEQPGAPESEQPGAAQEPGPAR